MRSKKRFAATAAASSAVLALALAGCGGSGGNQKTDNPSSGEASTGESSDEALSGELRVLCYDCTDPDNAFQMAADEMRAEHPDLNVTVESTSFQQLTTNAQLLFQSSDAPDVALFNQGTATVGNLAATGVLTDITEAASRYGWDKDLPSSLQVISKYDPTNGLMSNDGQWYGLGVQGEYAGLTYFNLDMFEEYGLAVPNTFEELEEVMQAFLDDGVQPLATEGAETATQHIWYQLALSKVQGRDWVNEYQLYEGDVDWEGPEIDYAFAKFDDWVKKGFIPASAAGLNAEEMVTGFIAGQYPIMISGSWWFGRLLKDAPFEWTVELMPGNTYSLGATGKLWVVPESAKNKEAAYAFLDLLLRNPVVQGEIARTGGLAFNPPEGAIDDPQVEQFQTVFNELLADDGISLYPDWPSAGMFDQLNSSLQGLINQNISTDEARDQIRDEYLAGKEALGLD